MGDQVIWFPCDTPPANHGGRIVTSLVFLIIPSHQSVPRYMCTSWEKMAIDPPVVSAHVVRPHLPDEFADRLKPY